MSGLMRLRELGRAKRSAIMCAEAVWWRCHRRIIADYFLAAGDEVFRILGRTQSRPSARDGRSCSGSNRALTYPNDPGKELLY
jgi:uncharacterized protein (DUF488 family)